MLLRTALLTVIAAAIGSAQDAPEFQVWMKQTQAAMGVLNKLPKKAGPEAMNAAEHIGGVYERMIGYWRQRNAADAIKLSEQGKAAAAMLATAAYSGDDAAATAALKTLSSTCKPCHDARREKVGEKYRLK